MCCASPTHARRQGKQSLDAMRNFGPSLPTRSEQPLARLFRSSPPGNPAGRAGNHSLATWGVSAAPLPRRGTQGSISPGQSRHRPRPPDIALMRAELIVLLNLSLASVNLLCLPPWPACDCVPSPWAGVTKEHTATWRLTVSGILGLPGRAACVPSSNRRE
jgi:hypothetical protein